MDVHVPVYSVTKHRGFVPSLEYFKKQVFSRELATYKLVEAGEFAYATIHLDEGSIGRAPGRALVSPMYTVFAADERRVDPGYLLKFLKSPRALASYQTLGTGTAERRKSIALHSLGRLEIPLPPLPEQRRIAAILDQADELRVKRRRSLALLDELAAEMFQNAQVPSGHSASLLGEVTEMFGGNSLGASQPFSGQRDGYLHIKVSDLNHPDNSTEITRAESWSSGPGSRASTAPAGAIVIPKRGGAIATNKKRILSRPAVLDPNLMAVVPKPERLLSEYLFSWFLRLDLATITSGSTVPQLNKQDLFPLMIEIPSMTVQSEFVARLAALNALRARHKAGVLQLDTLFASLQNRAFRGEL